MQTNQHSLISAITMFTLGTIFRIYSFFILCSAIFLELPKLQCVLDDEPYHLMCFLPGMPLSSFSKSWICSHLLLSFFHLILLFFRVEAFYQDMELTRETNAFSIIIFISWIILTTAGNLSFLVSNSLHDPSAPLVSAIVSLAIVLLLWTWIHREHFLAVGFHFIVFSIPVLVTVGNMFYYGLLVEKILAV